MTLRSRRKRPTTALTSSRAKCLRPGLSAAGTSTGKAARRVALAFSLMLGGPLAVAQQPSEAPWTSARQPQATTARVSAGKPVASTMTLQPVARFGEEPARAAAKPNQPQPPGWQLRWRSPNSSSSDASPAVAAVSATAEGPQAQEPNRILQAAFQSPDEQEGSLQLPETLELPSEDEPGDPTNPDIFERPFDNFPPSPTTPPAAESMEEVQPDAPADPPESTTPPSPSDLGPVPTDPMRSQPEPFDDEPPYRANPFPQRDRADQETGRPNVDDRRPVPRTVEGLIPGRRNVYSCDDIRERLNERTIDKVSLDISPPFRPDMIDQADFQRTREEFEERQEVREWHSVDGAVMARGRLKDLAYEQVIVEAEHGGTEALPIDRISEGDLAYISEHWGLPQECRIERVAYQPRQWVPSTLTWKASALCHKPAYFEEVNLERYGHTAGPLAQPVISTAHFFFNIAVLPYKAGIHPPGECQYTLGYYRPGSCAPWILPPVPISLRGAVTQAAVVGAGVGLIP